MIAAARKRFGNTSPPRLTLSPPLAKPPMGTSELTANPRAAGAGHRDQSGTPAQTVENRSFLTGVKSPDNSDLRFTLAPAGLDHRERHRGLLRGRVAML
jgi:hypothetical protein